MTLIRPATPADAEAIARVHVAAWREAYVGIVPDDFLASLSVEKRLAMWRGIVAGPRPLTFVAEAQGQVVGFVDGGPSRSPELPFDGELNAIYLLAAHQGQRIGRDLFAAVVDALRQAGYRSLLLWVLRDNPTVGFYRHLGGVPVGEKTESIGGKPLVELAMGWSALP